MKPIMTSKAETVRKSTIAGVRVVVRVRPTKEDQSCITSITDVGLELRNPRCNDELVRFNFDRCLGGKTTQTALFSNEVLPFINHAVAGYNASCFCYGPTGAGKTHTMQGSLEDPGIIPRAMEALLKRVAQDNSGANWNTSISASYLELYNEKIFDLFDPKGVMVDGKFKASDLPIRENQKKEIIIPGLSELAIDNNDQFGKLFANALTKRKIGATKLNSRSSRSHAVLIIKIRKKNKQAPFREMLGKLHLIDLAGSEDNRRTDNVGIRMKESGAINTSLFVLGKVVDALNAKQHRIPYRDSKLTRLLQDSLGGTSHACMILNVAPMPEQYLDTYKSLNFASKSKNIFNAPVLQMIEAPIIEPEKPQPRVASKRTKLDLSPPNRVLASHTALHKPKVGARAMKAVAQPKPSSETLPPMTPTSTMIVAKAVLQQAKLHRERGELEDALEHYLQAQKLMPHKEKLATIVSDLQQQLAQPTASDVGSGRGNIGRSDITKARRALTNISNKQTTNTATTTTAIAKTKTNMHTMCNTALEKKTHTSKVTKKPFDQSHDTVLRLGRYFDVANDGGKKQNTSADTGMRHQMTRRSSVLDPEWEPLDFDDRLTPKKKKRRTKSPAERPPSTNEPAPELDDATRENVESALVQMLNSASVKELMAMNGVGKKRATNIVDFRDNERSFGKVEDLRLCGFGAKLVTTFVQNNACVIAA
eukprot:m.210573 g.210573  ORF g.210573 m.210573 type:complete len:707 (-) comp33083_c0_seq1:139-2259(-)